VSAKAENAVKAVASLGIGRRKLYVVPVRSALYGLISLAIVLLVLLIVDRLVLGMLERGGWTAGELWARHNKLVEENHRRKTTTNECELRHWRGEPLPERGQGRRTILVMGDSFVWGPPYITLNHLWWRQLAIELERRGYRQVDVVAAGHPGWSTRRQLECARELIPEVKPDLVIWGYVTNDPDEKMVRQIFDTQDRPPYGQRIRRLSQRLLPNLAFKFESLRDDKLANQYAGPEYGYAYFDWELKLLEGENFARYRDTVSKVGTLLREANVPGFLITLPRWPCREHYEPRYGPALEAWQSAAIPIHNSLDEFIGRYGNQPLTGPQALRWGINPADSHPGPRATHFHAVMATDYMEKHWPDTLGQKDPSQPHELAINDWLPHDLDVRQTNTETRQTIVAPPHPGTDIVEGTTTVQTFELDYPLTEEFMPRLPLEEPTVLLALRFPVPIHEIRLEGPGLTGARFWVSMLDPVEKCDQDQWQEVGKFFGGQSDGWFAHFTPPDLMDQPVAGIRFRATVRGANRRLTLTLIRHPRALERR
jgi:hypothetical protein